MDGKRGARGRRRAQLRLGGVADGIVPEPQAGHRGVDRDRVRYRGRARVAYLVAAQPVKSEQVRGWSGEFRQKARWSGDGQGMVNTPQRGRRGVDRDRICDRGRAGVADIVIVEPEALQRGVDRDRVCDRCRAGVADLVPV